MYAEIERAKATIALGKALATDYGKALLGLKIQRELDRHLVNVDDNVFGEVVGMQYAIGSAIDGYVMSFNHDINEMSYMAVYTAVHNEIEAVEEYLENGDELGIMERLNKYIYEYGMVLDIPGLTHRSSNRVEQPVAHKEKGKGGRMLTKKKIRNYKFGFKKIKKGTSLCDFADDVHYYVDNFLVDNLLEELGNVIYMNIGKLYKDAGIVTMFRWYRHWMSEDEQGGETFETAERCGWMIHDMLFLDANDFSLIASY